MRKVHLVLLALISHTLIACGDFSMSLIPSSGGVKAIPENMFYKIDGSCEDGTLSFVALQGSGVQLWTDPAAVLVGQIELYMNKDGTFSARYREYDFTSKVFETNFSSTYSFDPSLGQIQFKDFGVGKIIQVRKKYYLDFEFATNINSQALAGQAARFRIAKMYRGIDTDRAQYCHYTP